VGQIRVGLADDQPLFRSGIRMIVDSQPDFDVAWEASDGREAVALAATDPVDIVLMDLEMPVMDGVQATARIVAEHPQRAGRTDGPEESGAAGAAGATGVVGATGVGATGSAGVVGATGSAAEEPVATRVVVLTTFELNDKTFAAIQAGASGFLLKNADPEFLLASLRTVVAGTAVIAPTVTTGLVHRFARRPPATVDDALDALTVREREIFLSIVAGLSNNEIAAHHHVSDATVKTHVSRILTKLGLRDRVQLVIYAYENGLVGGVAQE
jgi:DNA-binding NarL/FixJ family response regulator